MDIINITLHLKSSNFFSVKIIRLISSGRARRIKKYLMKNKILTLVITISVLSSNTAFALGIQRPQSLKQDSNVQIKPIEKIMQEDKDSSKLERIYNQPANSPQSKENQIILDKNINTNAEKSLQQLNPAIQIGTKEDITTYKKISLPEAIDYALSHNFDIKSTRLNINIAKNDIKIANRLKNPYFTSFYNMGRAATDNPNYAGFYFPFDIAKRGARKRLAQSTFNLTRGQTLLAELNLRLDVRESYVNLVASKSMVKILNDQRILLQELVNVAKRKYEVGTAPEMHVIQAKMTLNQLLVQLNSARKDVLIARYAFNMILCSQGFDTKEDYLPEQKEFADILTPKPTEKIPDFNYIFNIAKQKRLDLKNAQNEIEIAQKNLTLIIRQRVPDVELGAGYMFVPQALATDDQFSKGAFLGLNVINIPLLYQYTPEIRNAKLVVEQKQFNYKNVEQQALMNLHSAYDSFSTAQENLNYYSDVLLSESKQFLQMARKSYQVGKTTITDYIFIEQCYRNVFMGYTNSLADYYNAWVNLLREVNDEGLKLNG